MNVDFNLPEWFAANTVIFPELAPVENATRKRSGDSNVESIPKRVSETTMDGTPEPPRQRKKPGRKPVETEPKSKRTAQNRAAQRAFRERKEKYLLDLEERVKELEAQQNLLVDQELLKENTFLKQRLSELERENASLKFSFEFPLDFSNSNGLHTLASQHTAKPKESLNPAPISPPAALDTSILSVMGVPNGQLLDAGLLDAAVNHDTTRRADDLTRLPDISLSSVNGLKPPNEAPSSELHGFEDIDFDEFFKLPEPPALEEPLKPLPIIPDKNVDDMSLLFKVQNINLSKGRAHCNEMRKLQQGILEACEAGDQSLVFKLVTEFNDRRKKMVEVLSLSLI